MVEKIFQNKPVVLIFLVKYLVPILISGLGVYVLFIYFPILFQMTHTMEKMNRIIQTMMT